MGSRYEATCVAGRVDSMSQPGNAWPGAWKLLQTPPSMRACGSSPAQTGSLQSSLDSGIFRMFTFFLGLRLILCPPETNTKHTYLNVLDHPGDQVIKAARRFGRKAVLEITLHCNSRQGFFIEGHNWCQTYVEKKKTDP